MKVQFFGLLLLVFLYTNVFADNKTNAVANRDESKIYTELDNKDSDFFELYEGDKIKVTKESEKGWHKVIYKNEEDTVSGFIHEDDFDYQEKSSPANNKKRSRNPNRKIYDVLYFPSERSFFVNLEYGYGMNQLVIERDGSTLIDSEGSSSNAKFAFGFTPDERALVKLTTEYYFYRYSETSYGINYVSTLNGGGEDTESMGFLDPELELKFRILDEPKNSITWDLKLSYAPKLFEAKSATRRRDGTVADGRHKVGAGIGLGKNLKNMSFTAETFFTYNFEAVEEDQDNWRKDYTYGGHTLENQFTFQYILNNYLQSNLFLGYGLIFPSTTEDSHNRTDSETEAFHLGIAGIQLNIAIIPENLLLYGKAMHLRMINSPTMTNDNVDLTINKGAFSDFQVGITVQF